MRLNRSGSNSVDKSKSMRESEEERTAKSITKILQDPNMPIQTVRIFFNEILCKKSGYKNDMVNACIDRFIRDISSCGRDLGEQILSLFRNRLDNDLNTATAYRMYGLAISLLGFR
eukprot:gnl/Chilomastix_caulleri/1896.p1 GENE.gnl/Chilomastix_caulleri/1896~~gnl/Chilomastix_caulleri/1896.p1  ORF type:complete len:116 (+),score=3.12 gnl/Chilomastix_caulleri/1896:228-575(+)